MRLQAVDMAKALGMSGFLLSLAFLFGIVLM
jgi:hypothetical protein